MNVPSAGVICYVAVEKDNPAPVVPCAPKREDCVVGAPKAEDVVFAGVAFAVFPSPKRLPPAIDAPVPAREGVLLAPKSPVPG